MKQASELQVLLHQGQRLEVQAARLSARLQDIERRRLQQEVRVAAAKRILECAPRIQEVLQEAQRRVHQQVVGGLSDMLTYLLQGVMGDADRAIVCETEVDARGASQVRFHVQRSSGEVEDILGGNGGSIANVVCMGLRLIAVHRAKRMRRLLVLDEPDCWLSPALVPAFVGLLQKTVVSMPQDIQVLMITHHDVADLDGINTVDLLRSSGRIVVKARVVRAPQPGQIERLELRHWRSHTHTVVPLGAGLTILKGANNLGKSAIVEAMRCMAYGGARPDVVQHGQSQASVTIHLVGGQRLELLRNRRAKPAITYRWLDAEGGVLREDFGGKGAGLVPPWMAEALGIWEVDEQQIHVADQKQPVFLLDQPAHKQTAILSVGQEAQAIVTLLQRYQDVKRQAQQSVREGEVLLERMRRLFVAAGDWRALSESARALAEQAQMLQERLRAHDALVAALAQMRRLHGVQGLRVLSPVALPHLHDAQGARRLCGAIAKLARACSLPAAVAPELPRFNDVQALRKLCEGHERLKSLGSLRLPVAAQIPEYRDEQRCRLLAQAIRRLRWLQRCALPEAPVLEGRHDDAALREMLSRLRRIHQDGLLARQEHDQAKSEHASHLEVIRRLESELGCCPLCGQSFHAAAAVCR